MSEWSDRNICSVCGRYTRNHPIRDGCPHPKDAAYCYVVHDYYGCDTGCCGHEAYLCDAEGRVIKSCFLFEHPDSSDDAQWAVDLLERLWPGIPIRLEECQLTSHQGCEVEKA